MNKLRDIPNESGFRLYLIRANETTLPCFVSTTPEGSFATYSLTTKQRVTEGEPWKNFIGWKPIPKHPLEIHKDSLPAMPGQLKSWTAFTKEQLTWQKRPVPKNYSDAELICNLGTVERITKTRAKSSDGKTLFLWEFWQS